MSFRFPCYRELVQNLGETDAVVECIELAVRDLAKRCRGAESRSAIQALSREHGVRVDAIDESFVAQHASHLYLVSVHQNFEGFLRQLIVEHPDSQKWVHNEKVDLLSRIATNIGISGFATRSCELEFAVYEHYRTLRNQIVHPHLRAKRCISQELRKRVADNSAYRKLNAPNDLESTGFDDFILMTRVVKVLAAELCEAARPDDNVLRSLVWEKALARGLVSKLLNNRTRLVRALAGQLRTEYSLRQDEAMRIAESGPLA